jgi:hypothetical protein
VASTTCWRHFCQSNPTKVGFYNDTHTRYPSNLNLDLCDLLSGNPILNDEDEIGDSTIKEPGKGKGRKQEKDQKKRKVKKSVVEIDEECQFGDVINQRNCH